MALSLSRKQGESVVIVDPDTGTVIARVMVGEIERGKVRLHLLAEGLVVDRLEIHESKQRAAVAAMEGHL